jgi:hypothetical protein
MFVIIDVRKNVVEDMMCVPMFQREVVKLMSKDLAKSSKV